MVEVELITVAPTAPEALDAVRQYFHELNERFPSGFDATAALASDVGALGPPGGAFVLMRHGVTTIACGGVQRVDTLTGEIKRMWIHRDWRGLGLGRRMLEHLEGVARTLGYSRFILDTNAVLVEAIAMYQKAGYVAIERYNDNPYAQRWFAKDG